MKIKFLYILLVAASIAFVYRAWFLQGLLSGGDFPFYFSSMYTNFLPYPYAWGWNYPNGLGGFAVPLYFFHFSANLPQFFGSLFSIPWNILERIGYLYPFLLISLVSSYFLMKKVVSSLALQCIGVFLFVVNTYILMLVGGGQIFLGLAYAITPAVLVTAFRVIEKQKVRTSLLLGLLFGLQLGFDLRIFYITLVAIGILYGFGLLGRFGELGNALYKHFVYLFLIPITIVISLHFYWLLPTLLVHQNPLTQLGMAYSSTQSVKYFSFAKFEDTVGLLHPNWPENIFGKVGFMKPEFLLLPILAFSALFFVGKKQKVGDREQLYMLYFVFIGLFGAFLAKGTQDPFGGIYLWLFSHLPGFVMFRDPTKWYLLVAISYSVLIPFSLENMYGWLKDRKQFSIKSKFFNLQNLFVLLIVIYLLFLIRPAIAGQLGGTFKAHSVPAEYVTLEKYLLQQQTFSRTFWVPGVQRYGFNTPLHPAIAAADFFGVVNTSNVLNNLEKPGTERFLQETAVRYVVVPYDSEGEIFLKDRKYDDSIYLKTIRQLQTISWLHKMQGFGKIAVFSVANPEDHFWTMDKNVKISYKEQNPSDYIIGVSGVKKNDILIFSESFDNHWIAQIIGTQTTIVSQSYNNSYNSFLLPQNGNYILHISYSPQRFLDMGLWVSGISLLVVFVFLGFLYTKRNE